MSAAEWRNKTSGLADAEVYFLSEAGPRRMGPRGQQGTESREVTLNNGQYSEFVVLGCIPILLCTGKRRIWSLANGLSLPERVCDSAQRTFTLAVANQFTKGRRAEYVAASCLYVACRLEKTTHMLIDFSDFLRVRNTVFFFSVLKFTN